MGELLKISYKPPGALCKAFFLSNANVRGIRGPVGSGKSAACCIEIMRRAKEQRPGRDGIRRSRWAIIRNTYAELRTTTMATWLSWFPESHFGPVVMNPPPYLHHIRKGDVDLEVYFIALDSPEDVKKLLSLELTGGWINEAREVSKAIVDALTSRIRRYPAVKDGGSNFFGVIMDTNAPDVEHWWPVMAGESPVPEHLSAADRLLMLKPQGWEFFTQPGAMLPVRDLAGAISGFTMNPLAENLHNLDVEYYPAMLAGKRLDWVLVYVCNELGQVMDGKPVISQFQRERHVAPALITAVPGVIIVGGIDFGLTPAAVFKQQIGGRWRTIGEIVTKNSGVSRFAPLFKAYCIQQFPDHNPEQYLLGGDPAGDSRAQTDEQTPFQMLRKHGIQARATHTNDVSIRLDAQQDPLMRVIDGQPGHIVSPNCTHLIAAYAGGYEYRRVGKSGDKFEDVPNKNMHSHIADADQYAFLIGGEGKRMTIGNSTETRPVQSRPAYQPWNRPGPGAGRAPRLR